LHQYPESQRISQPVWCRFGLKVRAVCSYRSKENQATAREKPLQSGQVSTRYKVSPNKSPLKSNNLVYLPLQISKVLIDWCNCS
jgi:hypothetical protein